MIVTGCVAENVDLHIAGTDVGGFGFGVVGVEVSLDGGVEQALCGEDEVDGVSACALAAGEWRDVVGDGFDLGAGVGGGDGKADDAEDREVDDVVADVGDLVEGAAFIRDDLVKGVALVVLALVDVVDLEIAGADGDDARVALGDEADLETSEAGHGDAHAIVGVEGFDFSAGEVVRIGGGDGVGDDDDIAVGEDAVDVVEEDFDAAGAVFGSK
jgi:hypothetical protein